ncbi:hypothetical protein BGZ60DRAFT_535748 [Tricladium varicosporioides]|nr:hypothetical protein BGZ60DRAFT_535748 [Hymenoscyphus varicosporioides]
MRQFCANITYESTCNGTCNLSWERADIILWMNRTCNATARWTGLPNSWMSLLNVQESELVPKHWGIGWKNVSLATDRSNQGRSDIKGSKASDTQHCPSNAAKLGIFAAVNIAMALAVPILGRRTTVEKITFGICGKPQSRGWLLTGPLGIAFHIASNPINAYIIHMSPGYLHVEIGQLILLWCTRPRLG